MIAEQKDSMSAKKILFIDQTSQIGGAEIQLLTLVELLNKADFTPYVLAPGDGPLHRKLRNLGVNTLVSSEKDFLSTSFILWKKKFFDPFAMLWDCLVALSLAVDVTRAVKRIKPAIIFTNSFFAHIAGSISAKLTNTPCIWYLQDIIKSEKPLRLLFEKFANSFAAHVVCNSKATRHSLDGKVSPEKLSVIYPAVKDISIKENSRRLEEEFHIREGDKVVNIFGRIDFGKGQADFIRAVPEVRRKYPNLKCFVVGEAAMVSRSYFSSLQILVKKLNLQDVVFFTGFREDVHDIMSISDVVVIPSRRPEPFGLVALEALLLKKPVVATRTGGLTEIIEHEGTGLLCHPGDYEKLALAILQILDNPDLATRLANRGYEVAKERFPVGEFIHQFTKTLQSF